MLTRSALAATAAAALAAPAAASAATITPPPPVLCFPDAGSHQREDRAFATYPPTMVPTVNVTGIVAPRGVRRTIEISNAPGFPETLFQGTSAHDADPSGSVTVKYLDWTPDGLLTRGDHKPTGRTELNRLVVNQLFEVPRIEHVGTIEFRVGILAADVVLRDRESQRRKTRWRVSGLGSGTYYAHFRQRGRTTFRMKLGSATGPCGYLVTRRFAKPPRGTGPWDVYITNGPRLDLGGRYLHNPRQAAATFGTVDFRGVLEQP